MKKNFLLVFLLTCTVLEILTFVVYQQTVSRTASKTDTARHDQILHTADKAFISAIDLVSAEQDYFLSTAPADVKAYQTSAAALTDTLANLHGLINTTTSGILGQSPFLDALDHMETISAEHLKMLRKGEVSKKAALNLLQESRSALGQLRETLTTLTGDGTHLTATQQASTSNDHNIWNMVLVIGTFIFINLSIFVFLIKHNLKYLEKLNQSKELFAIILDGLNDGIFDYNVDDGSIVYSPTSESLLGYSSKELGSMQNHFYKYVHPDDLPSAIDIMNRYLNNEIPRYNNTFRFRHKDGHWLWILSRGIAVKDEDGHVKRLIGTHTDITIQKQREEELNYFIQENERQHMELVKSKGRAEIASQAKSDFLATMSHEIRTPMNVVVGLAQLMLQTGLDAKQQRMMEALHANSGILLQLVDSLLDISRIEAAQINLESRSFSIDTIFDNLRAIFDNVASSQGVKLLMMNETGEQSFIGDPARTQQILVNLIGNALKFTSRGSIVVTASAEPQGDKSLVHLSVADTGIGIEPEKLDMIFEKFVQADQSISRRYGGSGLGLAICKSLAEMMGGTIRVASQLGQGSEFKLDIPFMIDKKKKTSSTVTRIQRPRRNVKPAQILVVEDYPANVLVMNLLLEELGYKVDVATNGTEALVKLTNVQIPYYAVLMDVQMQDMDGYETTRRIRMLEQKKGIHHYIIGVTAHAMARDRERCLEAGMDDYMSKPIQIDLLDQKLGLLLAQPA